ncbi:MAG TPA: RluA family pseudouridine synthase [Holophagaceae bacterium]|jgi:RluA family pseudouridine synthase|nr:RluA family pseudouridine synthase [Holophagaceae bacterium]
MALQRWTFTVDASDAGLRLDQLIAARTGLSRRQAREILRIGGVQVARKRIRVAGKLIQPGMEVRVAHDPDLPEPPDIEVPIVFEDTWLLAVDKPAGIPTQGTWATDQHDLQAMLRKQRPDLKLFLHHRLDLGTSGLLVFAKDAAANPSLTKQFTEGGVRKSYLARISSPLAPCTVDRPVGRVRLADPGRFGCEGDLIDPRAAQTDFEAVPEDALATLEAGHWILARPRTGRTHQIRVHLVSVDRPILGDRLYGGADSDRLWLHAWKLSLTHPVTGTVLELEAPPIRFRRPE